MNNDGERKMIIMLMIVFLTIGFMLGLLLGLLIGLTADTMNSEKMSEGLVNLINQSNQKTILIDNETQKLLDEVKQHPEKRDISQTRQGCIPLIDELKGVQLEE